MSKKTFFFISIWPKRFASVPLQFLFLQNPLKNWYVQSNCMWGAENFLKAMSGTVVFR